MSPLRVAVAVNTDFESRSEAQSAGGPRAYEADAAVLETAATVEEALRSLGHHVRRFEVASSPREVERALLADRPDVVFNLVESVAGDYGREWEVPRWLSRLRLPYTGNGPLALLRCAAKDRARERLARAGVNVARGIVIKSRAGLSRQALSELPFPLFVKPARVDGSIGIDSESIVTDYEALERRLARLEGRVPGPFLVERYLPGKELNVAIFPEPELGHVVPTEIDFSGVPERYPRIITYDSKWNPESPEYVSRSVPAQLSSAQRREVEDLARRAFVALGGRGYGRVDMRFDEYGAAHVIDVNPNNDLHAGAGLAAAAHSVGVSYEALIASIVASAEQRPRRV